MRSRTLRSRSISIALFAVSLAACTSRDAGTTGGGEFGGTLIIASPGDATSLFPPYVTESNGRMVQELVFDRLARIGPNNSPTGDKGFTPELAQKWTWSPDSLSIAFSIDPRARWHDGKPVTASDVRYSFKMVTDPKVASPNATGLDGIDSVSVRDSLTAVVFFKKRSPTQFYDIAFQLVVLPEHVYGAIPPQELQTSEVTRTPIGSGRFRFVKWESGQRIELVADTTNFRGRGKLDRVIILPFGDPSAAMAQVLSGQADAMEAFPLDQAPKLDSNRFARPVVVLPPAYSFLGIRALARKSNTAPHPIFGDIRVRRAITMAVDREAMLKNVFGGIGRLGHGPFSMALPYADSSTKIPKFDTTAAKALLDSAGWRVGPNGVRAKGGVPFRFSVMVPGTSVPRRRYAVLIQQQLRNIGAQMDIDQMDGKAFLERASQGDFDAYINAFNTDPSPNGEKQNWATAGIGPTGQNQLHYSNHLVDALIDSASAAMDPAKAKAYMLRAHQAIIDDAPAIWLYDYVTVTAVARRFEIPPMRADGWFTTIPDWTVPPAKRIDRDRIGLVAAKQ